MQSLRKAALNQDPLFNQVDSILGVDKIHKCFKLLVGKVNQAGLSTLFHHNEKPLYKENYLVWAQVSGKKFFKVNIQYRVVFPLYN